MSQERPLFKRLLSAPVIKDEPGDDGLTSFAIMLALKDKVMVSDMLMSNLQSKEDILFLSEEVLKVHVRGDAQLQELQESIRSTIKSPWLIVVKHHIMMAS